MLLYTMLCGRMPFRGNNQAETLAKVKKGVVNFNMAVWKTLSIDSQKLIIGLLQKDPSKRLKAEECLHNAWILKYM